MFFWIGNLEKNWTGILSLLAERTELMMDENCRSSASSTSRLSANEHLLVACYTHDSISRLIWGPIAFLTSVSVTETSLPRPYFSWRSRCYWHPSTVFVTYFWFLFFSNGEIKQATVSHFFKRFGHGMSWRTKTGPPLANFLSETTLSCFSRVLCTLCLARPCSRGNLRQASVSWCSWQLRRLKGRVTWDTDRVYRSDFKLCSPRTRFSYSCSWSGSARAAYTWQILGPLLFGIWYLSRAPNITLRLYGSQLEPSLCRR